MSRLVYLGNGQKHPSLPEGGIGTANQFRRPQDYIAEPGLVNAVNVALILGKPLLLTGEPGTGKTQLAQSLAWELGLGEPLRFETKSTSAARDLFYTFDTVGRFKATDGRDALSFLAYNALGKAILLANDKEAVSDYLTPRTGHTGKRRSVVLIDEIDKAPRDFPNDLLNELDYLHFALPELENAVISAHEDYRPIVVITSNSEKDLPDAFLRRCVYYNIQFPSREMLQNIVLRRLGEFAGASSALLSTALDLFYELRKAPLRKTPATAELLDWLLALRASQNEGAAALTPELALQTLSSLIKTAEDQERARQVIERWANRR